MKECFESITNNCASNYLKFKTQRKKLNLLQVLSVMRSLKILFMWLKHANINHGHINLFFPESQQNLSVDKDTTLLASSKKAKTLVSKVRNIYKTIDIFLMSLITYFQGTVFD